MNKKTGSQNAGRRDKEIEVEKVRPGKPCKKRNRLGPRGRTVAGVWGGDQRRGTKGTASAQGKLRGRMDAEQKRSRDCGVRERNDLSDDVKSQRAQREKPTTAEIGRRLLKQRGE